LIAWFKSINTNCLAPTGSQGDTAWTTRFGLIPAGGNLTTEPEQTQPDGKSIFVLMIFDDFEICNTNEPFLNR
jgi:hypothetical protein